nr:diaminopimelate epimerase [Thiomicrospira sp. WB1]
MSFRKMQGLGNDFMVIDATESNPHLTPEEIQAWSDRHFGVGFDQLLMVETTQTAGVDFRYRIFNADGSEVAQCGNGARCFARFVVDKGLTDKREITVETASGVIVLYVREDGWVRVNMGHPRFAPADLPFKADGVQPNYELALEEQTVSIGAVSMGNPHALVLVDDVESAPVASWGPQIEAHGRFPERVNVGFAEVLGDEAIRLRVYERGAGETLACGTGACAAMVILRQWGQVGAQVRVELKGGPLQIEWSGEETDPVWMTGPAETVFDGEIPRSVKPAAEGGHVESD